MGFIDEVREIVRACPKGRQTMLFSATLTDQVNDLARLSLHNPQKISVDAMYTLADHLIQEFIRIRPQREGDREAMVLALCARTFHSRVIVFFRSKQHCHRMAILFGLHKLNCAELHGNLTQTQVPFISLICFLSHLVQCLFSSQRLEALEKFRDGTVNFLLCTDLAARGLDIKGVETVINFSFPQQLASYIHRVGRTARAGLTGRSGSSDYSTYFFF
jgi:ATP-dependent RNA helicase DDX27